MSPPAVEVRDLTKTYDGRTVVDRLSFTVEPGRITGFLGPNGAGKSTTMRLMVGLDHAEGGSVTFGGRSYRALARPAATVGCVFDAGGAHPGRRALDHLSWVAACEGLPTTRPGQVLAQVGLASAARTKVRKFSLGMRQRLGLATALLGDPGVLLLDEPLNGLDPEGVRWVRQLLSRFAAEGRAVLVSSHLLQEMAVTAEHLVVIGQGRLLADGSLAELTRGHRSLEEAYFALTSGAASYTAGAFDGVGSASALVGTDAAVAEPAVAGPTPTDPTIAGPTEGSHP